MCDSGDPRADAHTSLAAFHTMFAREHNRIADKLSHFNGKLSDEELYNRARKILIACFQHITYNEFLPILLGDVINKNPGLQLEKTGYANSKCLIWKVEKLSLIKKCGLEILLNGACTLSM